MWNKILWFDEYFQKKKSRHIFELDEFLDIFLDIL